MEHYGQGLSRRFDSNDSGSAAGGEGGSGDKRCFSEGLAGAPGKWTQSRSDSSSQTTSQLGCELCVGEGQPFFLWGR